MGKMHSLVSWLSEGLFILLGSLFVLLPNSPLNSPYSYRDSGVFLYMGWRILNGELPYIDVWDHKPPLIYYLNALGLSLSNNNVWGIWTIELIFLFLAALIGFILLKKLFGLFPAVISTFIWLLSLVFVIQGGNLTTEYTLPFQFGALFLFYIGMRKRKVFLYLFGVGVLGGLAFFTKQTVIGIWLAMIIFFVFQGVKHKSLLKPIKHISMIILGFLLVAVIIAGYFYFHGALHAFWDSAFIYNFAYSLRKVSGLNARLLGILDISSITKTGIYHLSAIGIILFLFLPKRKLLDESVVSIVSVAMIALPLEILLINAPGTTFPHYFMSILPVLALFTGLLFFMIDKAILTAEQHKLQNFALILITIGLLLTGSFIDYRNNIRSLQAKINEPIIQYIIEKTEPEDFILVWGAETMVNFYTQRVSPTLYVYQYPLYRVEYTSEEMVNVFLDDIINNQPKLIINSWGKHEPIFVFPVENDEINQKLDHIRSIYNVVDEVNTWQVYQITTGY